MTDTIPRPRGFADLTEDRRAEFEAAMVRRWRITWPDDATEIVQGHHAMRDGDMLTFTWSWLGAHRIVNLAHVRDIAELDEPAGVVE